jgi:hypothetical protein
MSEGDDHYSAERLERFLMGALPPGETRDIIGHLARGCERCCRIMAPLAVLVLGGEPAEPAGTAREAEYDAAITRSFARARAGAGAIESRARRGHTGPRLCQALIARSASLRHESPQAMIRYAELAAAVADNLTPERYGSLVVADLQARALAELANARRVADDLDGAEGLLLRAARRAELGSGDTALLARILSLAASLASERRRFDEMLPWLAAARTLYAERGDDHQAGRALLSQGLYVGYAGDPEAGVGLLLEGLRRVDLEREPELEISAVHNLLWFLSEDGRAAEAARLLELARPAYRGTMNVLRRRWLGGRIAAGLGELATAAAELAEVRTGFHRLELPYNSALVGLDLAAVRLEQGEGEAAYAVLGEVLVTFSALHVEREGAAALLLLAEAVERRRVDVALLHATLAALGERIRH